MRKQELTPSMQQVLDDLRRRGDTFIRHYGSLEALVRRGIVRKEWRVTETVVIGGRLVERRKAIYSIVEEKENV